MSNFKKFNVFNKLVKKAVSVVGYGRATVSLKVPKKNASQRNPDKSTEVRIPDNFNELVR